MEKVSDLLNNKFNLERNLKQQGNIKYDFSQIMNKQNLISNLDGKCNSTSVVCDGFGTMTTIIIPPKFQGEMAANPEKKKYVDSVIKDFFAQQRQIENHYESLEIESKIKYNFQVNKADNLTAVNNESDIKSHIIKL